MALRIPNQPEQPPGTADVSYSIEAVHDKWRIYADTPEEVLGLLIDGYADQTDEQARLQVRLKLACRARVMVQTLLNAGESFEQATVEETHILLHRGDTPPVVAEWECAIPLVLITLFYQPIGNLPQPRTLPPGQIWWIDPSTAPSLLETLHQVRWLDLAPTDAPATWRSENTAYRNLGVNGTAGYRWRSAPT